MGRGNKKLKYRDVVGGTKQRSSKQKKYARPPKKTYSLHKNDHQKSAIKKRKFDRDYKDEPSKKPKFERPQPEVESSESEPEDAMTQLLATFDPKLVQKMKEKRKVAIESDIDSSDDEAEEATNALEDDGAEKATNTLKDDDEESAKESSENEADEPKEIEEEEIEAGELDDVTNEEDPFVKHLFYDIHENLMNSLQATPVEFESQEENWPELGTVVTRLIKNVNEPQDKPKLLLEDTRKYASPGTPPSRIRLKTATASNLFIKIQISGHLSDANPAIENGPQFFTPFQSELFSIVNNYQDLCFSNRTFANAEEIRFVYCLHAINHIVKTRSKVLHHNARLSGKSEVPDEFRDQGLVRPKVLILLPFRDSAYKVIRMLIKILLKDDKNNVVNKKRFIKEFTGEELVMPKKNPKPDDFVSTFTGNCNDDFRIGMTVTKKSLKLYADFYSSDIIVASILGLRTIIGAQGEAERDFDFLASIELLIMDQAELFLMQNIMHLSHIFKHIHLQPKEMHGTDFSRVRSWSLNGWEKYYRQTLIFSSTLIPEINSVFNNRCHNYAGKVKIKNPIKYGQVNKVLVQYPQYFRRFESSTTVQDIEARFEFFKNKVLPEYRESSMKQTLIYIPVYYDFVKIRNYFTKEDINFVQICEYSKEGKVARARDKFFHGETNFLLYTERHHFFNRIRVKGIRHLVFYQPPSYPHFYSEMCNLMQEVYMNKKVGDSFHMTISVLYSKFDFLKMEAIVGSGRVAKMYQSEKNVHMIIAENK